MIKCFYTRPKGSKFFSTISKEILKKSENFYFSPSILFKNNKNLPSVVTPTFYKSRLYDLLDTYPYLIEKEKIELIKLLENLSEFHIPLGDRQNLALKTFLIKIIETSSKTEQKIAAIKIYTKLINDSPSFTIRSVALIFAFNELNIDEYTELTKTLIYAKTKAKGDDLAIIESDLICLLKHLFLTGKLQIKSNLEVEMAKYVHFIYTLYTLFGTNDYIQYAICMLVDHLNDESDFLNKNTALELIEMICHTLPQGCHNYLRILTFNIIKNKYKLSEKQGLNIKEWFINADYKHDFFNNAKIDNK